MSSNMDKPLEISSPIISVNDSMSICKKCEELLPIDSFYKRTNGTIRTECKKCRLKDGKERYEKFNYSEKYRNSRKMARKKHKEKVRIKKRLLKEETKLKKQKLYEEEKLKKQSEKLRIKNEKKESERIRKEKIKEEIKLKQEEYLMSEEYLNKKKEINLRKYKNKMTDPIYKFRKNIQNNIRNSFKRGGFSKTSKTREILGAEWEVIKEYFEKRFKEGMTWDNQGEWHIDHILPISTATYHEDVIRLNHYTNLQPLWAEDNIKKSDKLTPLGILKEHLPYSEVLEIKK